MSHFARGLTKKRSIVSKPQRHLEDWEVALHLHQRSMDKKLKGNLQGAENHVVCCVLKITKSGTATSSWTWISSRGGAQHVENGYASDVCQANIKEQIVQQGQMSVVLMAAGKLILDYFMELNKRH